MCAALSRNTYGTDKFRMKLVKIFFLFSSHVCNHSKFVSTDPFVVSVERSTMYNRKEDEFGQGFPMPGIVWTDVLCAGTRKRGYRCCIVGSDTSSWSWSLAPGPLCVPAGTLTVAAEQLPLVDCFVTIGPLPERASPPAIQSVSGSPKRVGG